MALTRYSDDYTFRAMGMVLSGHIRGSHATCES